MKCGVCCSKQLRLYTTIDTVAIYRCVRCGCARVPPKTKRKSTEAIYSFSDYKSRQSQFEARYTHTVDIIKRFSKGKRVLEVGAGFGLLSSMLCKAGYTVSVLEPNVPVEYVKKLPVRVYKQYLESFVNSNSQLFDVIIMFDVLEHSDDPLLTVQMLKHLLAKNGIVVIQTPNYQSIMATLVKKWSWWMVEDHRFFFSTKSLFLLFDSKRWKKEYYTTYEQWYDFKKNLDGNFTNKLHKLLFFLWFFPCYHLFKGLFFSAGFGGLHLGIWRLK